MTAIRPSGDFCAMPPGLAAGHELIRAGSTFEMVPKSEWPKVAAGWQRTQQYGSHACAVLDHQGRTWSMMTFDARDRFGVYIRLMVPDAELAEATEDDERPVVTRFGTYHRDVLSAIVDMDNGAQSLLGWELEEVAGREGREFIHPDDVANAEANWLDALVSPGQSRRWRGRHLHKDGTYRWIEFTNNSRLDDEGYVVSEMMDISEEMATAEALRQRDELLARLNEALPLGVVQLDRDLRVVYANQQFHAIVGRESHDAFADQFRSVVEADRTELHDAVMGTLHDGTDVDMEVRVHLQSQRGVDRICAVSVRSLHDASGISGAVLCVMDITEATMMRRELERQATFDRLTECHNPTATVAALERVLATSVGGDDGTAALYIDLDQFKPVNDELGHAAGDAVLAAVARRLRELVRGDDLVGRMGGDEFLVVCPHTSHDAAQIVAQRITTALAEPITLVGGGSVTIGASIGVAWSADGSIAAKTLVDAADAAMYTQKRTRNTDSRVRTGR